MDLDRSSRDAERENASGDPRATDARDGKPLIVMVAVSLTATALVLGMMWMNNTRYDGANARAIAEQHQ
jgi:hypothetical protein